MPDLFNTIAGSGYSRDTPDSLFAARKRAGRCSRRDGYRGTDPSTGERLPVSCDALCCPVCRLSRGAWLADAVFRSLPTLRIGLSGLGPDPAGARRKLRSFIKAVRDRGAVLEVIGFLEHNPGGTGLHAFILGHGSLPSPNLVEVAASAVGVGIISQRRTWKPTRRGCEYGLKELLTEPERFLATNGNRLAYTTAGFFRDARTGMEYRGQTEAIRAAKRAWRARRYLRSVDTAA